MPHLLTPLGYEVDVRPQKGQLLVLDTDFPSKDWPVIMPRGEGDIIPLRHGEILIGATHENEGGFDLTVDTETTQPLIDNLIRLVPQLKGTPIKTVRVGTRAYTSDFLPFFGCVCRTRQSFCRKRPWFIWFDDRSCYWKNISSNALKYSNGYRSDPLLTCSLYQKKLINQLLFVIIEGF